MAPPIKKRNRDASSRSKRRESSDRGETRPPQRAFVDRGDRPPRRDFIERSFAKRSDGSTIFGVLPVLEALKANARRVDRIAIAEGTREHRLQEIIELARENGIRTDRVLREVIDRYVGPETNHQGVVAFAASADYAEVDEILDSERTEAQLIVILDGVEDPRNLGAVLRSVECSGADGVIIPERRAVGLTETVSKSSAGATEYVKVAKVTNLNRLIEELKERNIWVVGTSGDAATDYTDWDWRQPSALILGAEGTGLHRLVAENCDVLVKIPMYGKIDSLNVSVAAGVILFEARRQRNLRD
ncbi:MAG TPA: 23S rRNA (guanosine(2251)-2'-O)-methyltransferase RlmB [Pyrinomonadaceae bacterium]|nr:23S rRNA (guanosine(2251)-2'-O)-methyltransferase RlmB [Pyrinomonadaceae bacterium]